MHPLYVHIKKALCYSWCHDMTVHFFDENLAPYFPTSLFQISLVWCDAKRRKNIFDLFWTFFPGGTSSGSCANGFGVCCVCKLPNEREKYTVCREHWTGEVSADEWVPVFPVFNWPLVLWKKYFVLIKTAYSSRYSFVACNSWYA